VTWVKWYIEAVEQRPARWSKWHLLPEDGRELAEHTTMCSRPLPADDVEQMRSHEHRPPGACQHCCHYQDVEADWEAKGGRKAVMEEIIRKATAAPPGT
jgi:hypothetical protein